MYVLTPKQEAFCIGYVQHGDASKAYRDAGYMPGGSDVTINKRASELLRNKAVQARIAELRQAAAGAAQVSLESHLADLLWLREMSAKDGKYSAAVQAEIARGKAVGLYIERIAMSGGIEVTEKMDFSHLSLEEKRVMLAMLEKAGVAGQFLQ